MVVMRNRELSYTIAGLVFATLGTPATVAPAYAASMYNGPVSARTDVVTSMGIAVGDTGSPRGDSLLQTVELTPAQGELKTLLKAQVAIAMARGLTPFVELGAPWCENCRLLDTSMHDARMIDAFRGTYLIRLDIDQWGKALLNSVGLSADQGVPAIYAVDSSGHGVGQDITIGLAAAIPDDWSPEKTAVALKGYFRKHLWRHPVSTTLQRVANCDSTVLDPVTHANLAGGRRVRVVACSASAGDTLRLRRAVSLVAQAIAVYERLTGVPYPTARYVMYFTPGYEGARTSGGTGVVSFVLSLPDSTAERDRPAATAKILAHELAHQWGPRARGTDVGWLGEGFADFLTAQVWRAQLGGQGEEEFLFFYNTQWDENYKDAPMLGDLRTVQWGWPAGWFTIPWPGADLWTASIDQNPYYRGALIFWMLQQYLGDARFWAVMHTYLASPTGDDANAALLRAIQTVTGEDLHWFFQEWIHGHGYPRVTVQATYDAARQRVRLYVTQQAPLFRMPVTIRVGTSVGDVVTRPSIDAAEQTVVVEHVRRPPTFVVFDDADAIVKTLTFPQPTPWLVAQLRREAHPWQTGWAIDQLGVRAGIGDSRAQAALVTAASAAHHTLTRAQALIALQGVTQPAKVVTVQAVFMQGVQDTAVMVRRAAVVGLAHLATPEGWGMLRQVATHDASALVRAEALQRLLLSPTTSPEERRALFAQALQGPLSYQGYQDLLPFTAIRVLSAMGQCDSATVALIQTTIQRPEGAAMVRRVTDQLTMMFAAQLVGPSADPTCVQTFAAQLPLSAAQVVPQTPSPPTGPPLTRLPAAQCQSVSGTAAFDCYANANGWVLAKTPAHAGLAAADVAKLDADFARYFARPAPRFAVVTDTNAVTTAAVLRLRAWGAQGAIPWPIDPEFERLGVMNHELGHLYFLVAFPGRHAAAWLKEVAAILMERPASIRSRYRKLAWILQSPHRDEMLIPLATLFTIQNPGHPGGNADDATMGVQRGIEISGTLPAGDPTHAHDSTPAPFVPPATGVYSAGTVFYEECGSLIDFLITQSGDSTIFRVITDQAGRGTRMDAWLARQGARYHLPSSVAGLDQAWRQWMAQQVHVRAGNG